MRKLKYILAIAVALVLIISLSIQFLPNRQQPAPSSVPSFQVSFLDVGQADSIAIQCDGRTMLIDAGTNSTAKSLVNSLKALGISKIDVLVGTHPHEDHIGGMDSVINAFDVGTLYMPDVTNTTQTFKDVLAAVENQGLTISSPVAGNSFTLGSAGCTILAPNSRSYEDLNNYSIVIRLVYGRTSFLFEGDAQIDSEKEMLAKGYDLKSTVLKVGHHGSITSTSDEFLKAVSPAYAVISVGKDNDYGHPAAETLVKLNAAGAIVYRTDLNGRITMRSDGVNLTVTTEK